MMQRAFRVGLLFAVSSALPGLAGAPAAAEPPVATMTAGGSSVEWRPLVDNEGVVLTVAGPSGWVVRREFAAGQPAVFSLFNASGGALPDGVYRYDLQLLPRVSPELRRKAEEDRASAEPERLPAVRLPRGPSQSGTFAIRGGFVVTGGETEPARTSTGQTRTSTSGTGITPLDFVIADDLIVQGSACVGLDCVDGESFGFDTIRLKENNTRIKFEDTSVSPFPTTDWQLTANESSSGGLDKFSIEDITSARVPFTVQGGAPTNAMFIDSIGRVGLRTSTPVLDVHVNTGNTPAIRLEQNSGGGFTAQTWDVAGNEANFFVRDVTSGSTLPLRIRPGAPTSSLDISAAGNVGIGNASPSEKLHVRNDVDANVFALVENANNGVTSAAVLRAKANTAQVNFQAHADARTVSRFGVTLGGWAEFLQTTGNGLVIGTNGANPLILGTAATNRIHITGAGNVGIGTNAPAGKLDVNGSIYQRGGLLFADYVFEPGYRLESIAEHAEAMWKDRHLPAMPPRRADAEGREMIEIGDHSRGLLEELEKAHIYIAELNRRLEERTSALGELQRLTAALAERVGRLESAQAGTPPEQR